jgi:hypothetical protein
MVAKTLLDHPYTRFGFAFSNKCFYASVEIPNFGKSMNKGFSGAGDDIFL